MVTLLGRGEWLIAIENAGAVVSGTARLQVRCWFHFGAVRCPPARYL